ncbi:hypothetical protein F4083_01515 [Candidatus Poribacteria bacterium]|nr:hypothetical protein [Candidatus Poribacteria bacterium]MYB66331.1 hypothetical protein [Candidatus Poribacteria bacterium]MYF57078.1 hypothetical protein [Candidatus Poribacteria bacterium]MYI92991.1 hypothetical protein [Candidatus Poribacteria bacterium]
MARERISQADEWQAWAQRYDIEGGIRTFESGLTGKVFFGALFVGLLMMPGSIYLSYVSGQSGAAAAPWVAVILFTELARRSFTTARRQELYMLLSLTGAAVGSGMQYRSFIWYAYFVNTPQAISYEIADKIPAWVVPAGDSVGVVTRNLLHVDWLLPIGIFLASKLLGTLRFVSGQYILFRLTADLERLPYPMAPITAQGATALAETTGKQETWRWQVFSIGSMAGLIWGFIYIGVPALSGVMMSEPIQILKIPWIDFTQSIEGFAPTGVFALRTDFAQMLFGFVLPFPVVMSEFVAAMLSQFVLNPHILYRNEILHQWEPGLDVRATGLFNDLDFWRSYGIGKTFSLGLVGMAASIPMIFKLRSTKKKAGERGSLATPPNRGDFPLWLMGILWLIGMGGFVWLIHWMVPNFPLSFLLGFAFIYTPLNSYITARTFGVLGRDLFEIPYLHEITFILSRYEEIDIWFAPFPDEDYGAGTQGWRVLELTGTTFTSNLAATLLIMPILIISGILVQHFIWQIAPIPSAQYPFVQMMWPINATNECLMKTSLRDGNSEIIQAIRGDYVAAGFTSNLAIYGLLWVFKFPSMWFYGIVGGIGADPGSMVARLLGAIIGRFYMIKRFGLKRWFMFNPVLAAGFACGVGLIGMGTVAIALVSKAVIVKPF